MQIWWCHTLKSSTLHCDESPDSCHLLSLACSFAWDSACLTAVSLFHFPHHPRALSPSSYGVPCLFLSLGLNTLGFPALFPFLCLLFFQPLAHGSPSPSQASSVIPSLSTLYFYHLPSQRVISISLNLFNTFCLARRQVLEEWAPRTVVHRKQRIRTLSPRILALPLASYMTRGKSLNSSGLHFSHL